MRGGDAVRTGERAGAEGEVGGSKAGVALAVVDLACDEVSVAARSAAHIGDMFGGAGGAVADNALWCEAKLGEMGGANWFQPSCA